MPTQTIRKSPDEDARPEAERQRTLERKFPSASNANDELRIELAPKVSLLGSIVEMVEAFGEANGIPAQQIFLINLEIDELMTNYVRHSVRKVSQPRMELTVQEHEGKVILTVLDTGPPFNPLTAPPPDLSDDIDQRKMGGMGLHLVRSYCDRIHYELVDGYNRLTLEHDLQEDP